MLSTKHAYFHKHIQLYNCLRNAKMQKDEIYYKTSITNIQSGDTNCL